MSTFPKHVDTIIVGTGLLNSILAAACSRIGKSVLHLDENNYYGDSDASFTFQQLIEWIQARFPTNRCLQCIPQEVMSKSRMFCIDLSPKFLFSNGDMVDLLVKSNVARYHEFKNNIRILSFVNMKEIHVIPCRRNDVFTSPLLSNLADKRRLMKFIEMCTRYEDREENLDETVPKDPADTSVSSTEMAPQYDKPIGEFLEERGLSTTLREFVINSIAMVQPTDTTREACKRIKIIVQATEKYGRSPFLFPLYGCGEFPQSFCRLSAVFGGLYCLNTQINGTQVKDEHGKPEYSVQFGEENHSVSSDYLVIDRDSSFKLDPKLVKHEKRLISRGILITNRSVVQSNSDDEGRSDNLSNDLISFLRIPPYDDGSNSEKKSTIYFIEVNSSALVCPKEMNLVYVWCESSRGEDHSRNAESDLKPTVDLLFRNEAKSSNSEDSAEQPRNGCILWEFYYHQSGTFCQPSKLVDSNTLRTSVEKGGLFITNAPYDHIDYSSIIKEAEILFKRMYPDQEFLPRAPDPDEIIHSA